jgi:hypothetical protein
MLEYKGFLIEPFETEPGYPLGSDTERERLPHLLGILGRLDQPTLTANERKAFGERFWFLGWCGSYGKGRLVYFK